MEFTANILNEETAANLNNGSTSNLSNNDTVANLNEESGVSSEESGVSSEVRKSKKRKAEKTAEKLDAKRKKAMEKHKFNAENSCENLNCRRECCTSISLERRKSIYSQYWSYNKKEKDLFILQHCHIVPVARARKEDSRRN